MSEPEPTEEALALEQARIELERAKLELERQRLHSQQAEVQAAPAPRPRRRAPISSGQARALAARRQPRRSRRGSALPLLFAFALAGTLLGGAFYLFSQREALPGPERSDETPEFRALREKAESGDAEAMLRLAGFYWEGEVVARDVALAKHWFASAAESGDANVTAQAVVALDRLRAWEEGEAKRQAAEEARRKEDEAALARAEDERRARELERRIAEKAAERRRLARQARERARTREALHEDVKAASETVMDAISAAAFLEAEETLSDALEHELCDDTIRALVENTRRNLQLYRQNIAERESARAFRLGLDGQHQEALDCALEIKALGLGLSPELRAAMDRWRQRLSERELATSRREAEALADRRAEREAVDAEALAFEERVAEHYRLRAPERFRCKSCASAGSSTCSSCKGAGRRDCSRCQARGKRRCSKCGGRGRTTVILVDGGVTSKACGSCGADGARTCSRCRGSGRVSCGVCSADGTRDCRSCVDGYAFAGADAFWSFLDPSARRGTSRKELLRRVVAGELPQFGASVTVESAVVAVVDVEGDRATAKAFVHWRHRASAREEHVTRWVRRNGRFYLEGAE